MADDEIVIVRVIPLPILRVDRPESPWKAVLVFLVGMKIV